MKQQFLRRALGGALSIGLLMQPALAAVTPDIPQGWTTPFSDVAEGDWYTPFVSTLNSQGVINGYDDGRFGPNDAVKAGDAILMVVKAAGSGDQPAPEGGHYAAGYVQYALGPRLADSEPGRRGSERPGLPADHRPAGGQGIRPVRFHQEQPLCRHQRRLCHRPVSKWRGGGGEVGQQAVFQAQRLHHPGGTERHRVAGDGL